VNRLTSSPNLDVSEAQHNSKEVDLPPVEGIVVHGGKEELNLIGQSLPVGSVLVLEEVLAGLL